MLVNIFYSNHKKSAVIIIHDDARVKMLIITFILLIVCVLFIPIISCQMSYYRFK